MLNSNFPLLAGWSGKEQSLEISFPKTVPTRSLPWGISSSTAPIQRSGAAVWPSPPAWQPTAVSGDMAGLMSMAGLRLGSPNTCDLWNLPRLSHWAIPSQLTQSGTWQAPPSRMLAWGVWAPSLCCGQVLNMTPVDSGGRDTPQQDLHTILIWWETRRYGR